MLESVKKELIGFLKNKVMISVIILTCNRNKDLVNNLRVLIQQTLREKEIIIVDNGDTFYSDDINVEDVTCKYLKMSSNIGCDGRNYGIKAAKGDLIVSLDDDVLFNSQDALEKIIELFQKRPDVSVINFKIVFDQSNTIIPFNWFHPRNYLEFGDVEFETDYISEGAVAFRKEVFDKVGYYPGEFFLSHEGPDLAYRILDAGYKIIYSPQISVTHLVAGVQRLSWRNSYYDTRNQIWLGIRNLPVKMLIPHLIYRICTTFLFSLLRGHTLWYARGIRDAILGIPRELKNRKPISRQTVKRLRQIRKLKPGIRGKLIEFIEKIQLVRRYYN